MTQDFKTTLFSIEENSRSCSEDDSETDGETGASLNQQDQIPTCVCMGCRQVFEIVDTFLTIIICDLRNPKVRCVYCDNLINCFTAKSINYICLNSVPVPVPGAPVPKGHRKQMPKRTEGQQRRVVVAVGHREDCRLLRAPLPAAPASASEV